MKFPKDLVESAIFFLLKNVEDETDGYGQTAKASILKSLSDYFCSECGRETEYTESCNCWKEE